MSRQRRKKKDSGGDENGAPGWMTTYGDLMSLLLAFFILIVSFSSVQESEFKKAMGSLQRALGLLKSNVALMSPTQSTVYVPPRAKVREVVERMLRTMNMPEIEDNISFESSDEGVRVRISNPLLFDIGKANLKPEIFPVLDELAALLDTSNFQIIIEGHTDNIPINNEQFRSNWELSAARSVAVVEYFVDLGLDPKRFTSVAYGEYRPLEPNITSEGRAKNRRVEVFIPYADKLASQSLAERSEG